MVVYIDIETEGLNAYKQRITCIGIQVVKQRKVIIEEAIYHRDEKKLLQQFLDIYNRYSDNIYETITWNGEKFDHPYIYVRCLKHSLKYCVVNGEDIKLHFPEFLFDKWRRPSLNDAAEFLELGIEKSADGADAPYMFKYGKIAELKRYCLQDVRIMRKINVELKRRGN